MKPVSGKRMCKILEDKGWVFDRVRGSHHIYIDPASQRSLPVPVHGNRDLATGTQRDIMKKADLGDDDL
jgi:predicted RNA binding protein YcfA (HicA-like mRNA interferase family)